ncbi:MAG: hypothetical protein WB723_03440 [Candidatus Acidiferrales bacterium]
MRAQAFGSSASALCVALLLCLFSLMSGGACSAQAIAGQRDTDVLLSNSLDPVTVPALVIADDPPSSGTESTSAATSGSPPVGEPTSDWHFAVSPYLWFPGAHGTVGARGHEASIHVSPGDLLSHFRFGLMGLVDTRYKRIVMPVDVIWLRLGANNALPLTDEAVNAKLTASEFILTPKIGYRLVDSQIVKIDALTGFRYWYFGESLRLSTSNTSVKFSGSQNWADPMVGGRILANLSPKISVSIGGDVGGWNTGSLLDYQFGAILGYRIKPAVVLQAGYRYLAVDYRNGGTTLNVVTAGVLFGATFTLK